MLSSILTSGKQTKNQINDLFSKQIEIIEKQVESKSKNNVDLEDDNEQGLKQTQEDKEQMDADRIRRTLFVGNVSINAKKNDIRKVFTQYGEIEKVWFRSIPVDRATKKENVKLPVRAAVLMGKIQEGAQSQNCYILFKDAKSAKSATQQDGQLFMNLHLRCTLEGQKKKDHIKTAFVGNLPFDIEEEEVRKAFEEAFGQINYVRVIKDPYRHVGKGFGYVSFNEFQSLKKALQAQTIEIKGREVRIKKAAETTKREGKELNNAKNAFQRIQKKQQFSQKGKRPRKNTQNKEQTQNKQEKQQFRVQIHKKIQKMKKKRYNPKEIKEQINNIKTQRKTQVKDTNIFNQY
ncbi:unnamed protein product [Paramecium pentaurelia]|uniref:RRM domain-containing protein n=1 Tax=Paramecium pentaurelia TaxID=43138 RepID=A0A8S1VY79_9CILI|nr:unnamed protein product [Paramecium pentaurelia]